MSVMDTASEESCTLNSISLSISESAVFPVGNKRLVMDQAYVLSIKPDRQCISISGISSTGVFYGVVSLISLLQGESRLSNLNWIIYEMIIASVPSSTVISIVYIRSLYSSFKQQFIRNSSWDENTWHVQVFSSHDEFLINCCFNVTYVILSVHLLMLIHRYPLNRK